jgi:hypothetical protein
VSNTTTKFAKNFSKLSPETSTAFFCKRQVILKTFFSSLTFVGQLTRVTRGGSKIDWAGNSGQYHKNFLFKFDNYKNQCFIISAKVEKMEIFVPDKPFLLSLMFLI